MAGRKDRIQQAADALNTLGAQAPEDAPPAEAVEPPPVQPPSPDLRAAAEPPSPAGPEASGAVADPPHRPDRSQDGAMPAPADSVRTSLSKAALDRKIALRRLVIPPLLSAGLVMMLLGCWAVLVLALGRVPFGSGREADAATRSLAKMLLLAWPAGLILLGGTAFLMHEVYSHYVRNRPPSDGTKPRPGAG